MAFVVFVIFVIFVWSSSIAVETMDRRNAMLSTRTDVSIYGVSRAYDDSVAFVVFVIFVIFVWSSSIVVGR